MLKQNPFSTCIDTNGNIILQKNYDITFNDSPLLRLGLYIKAGLIIAAAPYLQEKPFSGQEDAIIKQIHAKRYDPDRNKYVITGGHLNQLYVRNMGIFFNALIDGRIPSTKEDWENRQRIALQTIALDLEVFRLSKKIYTTIVPITQSFYTAMDVRTRPSDTLFGILYGLSALLDPQFIATNFPLKKVLQQKHRLQTTSAAKALITKYKSTLVSLLKTYLDDLLDTNTDLIRKDIFISSAMDGVKRQSSFYDNVILWATVTLAKKLDIISISDKELAARKQKIIATFWDEKEGIFLDDLSPFSQQEKLFVIDCLIVTSTQFLHVDTAVEQNMLEKIVTYIQKNKLDKPFPSPYTIKTHKERMYAVNKYFVPDYMGQGIWSHWGQEYIKLLIMLGKYDPKYLKEAKNCLQKYTSNIEMYGGYPELYNKQGYVYNTWFYRAVLHNGWVINYEQAKMMLGQ